MKQLLILSGKGGTGKTTTAASFISFGKMKAFADCDVDAPNLHLLMGMKNEPEESVYYGSEKALIHKEKCISCGRCRKYCRFGAVIEKNGTYHINQMACEGCGTCMAMCPADAITMEEDEAGKLMLYKEDAVFSTARLKMGRGTSGKLVSEVKCQLLSEAHEAPIAVIDGSPGIGCPVIASISGVDMVLIVAEPSMSGISDMKRILKTCGVFGTAAAVCVNKYDTSIEKSDEIEEFCRKNKIPFVGRIPFDKHVPQAVNRGKAVSEVDCPARDALKEIYDKVITILLK